MTKLETLVDACLYFKAGQLDEETVKQLAINYLATDKEIIPNMMKILAAERKDNKELIKDMNCELSRITLTTTFDNRSKSFRDMKAHAFEGVNKFYEKWKLRIGPTLIIKGIRDGK